MNIKRAFLTAAAVLMIPGFAIAQVDTTFPVTVDVTPDAVVTFDVTRSCNSGQPLTETAPISEASGVTFSALAVAVGATCTIALEADSIPAGWEATDCDITVVDAPAQAACAIAVTQSGIEFEIDFEWDDTAEDATGAVQYRAYCENVVQGGTLTTLNSPTYGAVATTDQTRTWNVNGAPNPFEIVDGAPTAPPTVCYVDVVAIDDSSVEVSGCGDQVVEFGTTEIDCTLTASVFFEGIPTLSQYGMAIMVLLMLGVGFVGFRRFV